MKQRYFKYDHKDRPFIIEFAVYGSRRAMRVGMVRHRKKCLLSVSQYQREVEKTAKALCRMWIEKIGRRRVTICRIFLNDDDYSLGVLAHECFHAAKRVVTDMYRGHLREEFCAMVIEFAVDDFTKWRDSWFKTIDK